MLSCHGIHKQSVLCYDHLHYPSNPSLYISFSIFAHDTCNSYCPVYPFDLFDPPLFLSFNFLEQLLILFWAFLLCACVRDSSKAIPWRTLVICRSMKSLGSCFKCTNEEINNIGRDSSRPWHKEPWHFVLILQTREVSKMRVVKNSIWEESKM